MKKCCGVNGISRGALNFLEGFGQGIGGILGVESQGGLFVVA